MGAQADFSVEEATCSRKQEPRLVRTPQTCSTVGADGRKDGEEQKFFRISFGHILDFYNDQI